MLKIFDGIAPLWGICPFDKVSGMLIDCRAKSRLPENAASVVMFAFPYLLPEDKYDGLNVSKYAAVADYHDIVTAKLQKGIELLIEKYPEEEFACFADNSPIPEVRAACLAGLGVRGENSLLITEKYGSFVFLGEIVTTLRIGSESNEILPCLKCGRCRKVCPGGAITTDGIDKNRCLSHITQKKGELSEREQQLMKESGCVWGCDICQNICPMNRNASVGLPEFIVTAEPKVTKDTPIDGRAFAWRGEKVIRRNLEITEN